MLDRTLVIWMGEFGRTPKINLDRGPRPLPPRVQHRAGRRWSQRGQVIGASSADGTEVKDNLDRGQ